MAYVGESKNRLPAVHVSDAARLFRLALGKGLAGARYHPVGEEGVGLRDIAEVIGVGLKMPVESITPEEAPKCFGWLAHLAMIDLAASSAGIAAFKQQGVQSQVPSAKFLRDWIEYDTFVLLISEEIVDEYKEILARRGVRPHLIGAVINLIRSQAEEVPESAGNEISLGPDDEPFCTCAEVARPILLLL
jgi:hypothetical protein